MSHSKEPWRLCEHGSKTSLAGHTHGWHIERDDGTENGRMIVWEQINEDEGRRIVACVNACAGMDDPAAEIAALRAEVERLKAAAVPAGWKIVPVEPTPKMLKEGAMAKHSGACDDGYDIVGWHVAMPCYRAMLAAAPAPSQSADDEDAARAEGGES